MFIFRNQVKDFYKITLKHSTESKRLYLSSDFRNFGKMADKDIFVGAMDRYEGVTVDSLKETCTTCKFPAVLAESLKLWVSNKKRCIWFKVDLNSSEWIPHLTKNDFRYHHAKETYVMMYKWLPADESCNLPPYAHTMLAVGGLVVNDNNELLVVKEKYFISAPFWKLPGGYVEPGEDMSDAAIREVKEETAIDTQFKSLLTIRHTHGSMFGCSDMYNIVLLKPLSTEISQCSRELTACKWMKIEEFLNADDVHAINKFFVQKYLDYTKNNAIIEMKKDKHPVTKRDYTMYSVNIDS